MTIVNQDHDQIFSFTPHSSLFPLPVLDEDGICMGINLMLSVPIGTFDDLPEAVHEIGRILSSKEPICTVNGYSEGDFDDEMEVE